MDFSKAAGTKKSLHYNNSLRFFVDNLFIGVVFLTLEAFYSTFGGLFVLKQSIGINTCLAVNTAIPFGNTNKPSTSLSEEL